MEEPKWIFVLCPPQGLMVYAIREFGSNLDDARKVAQRYADQTGHVVYVVVGEPEVFDKRSDLS